VTSTRTGWQPVDLRPHGTRASLQRRLLSGLALGLFALGAALLASFAGGAQAGLADYPATLYLSGTSSGISSSYAIVGSAGISANARPAPTAASNGAGLLGASGLTAYTYEYTLVDGNGETYPSTKSNTVSVNNGQIRIGNLPTGVTVRLYRQKGANAPFLRVVELVNNASATYDDNNPDPLSTVVPLAQNRTDLSGSGGGGITGYFEYAPGNSITDSATNGAFGQVGAPGFDGKGWLVSGSGNVSFAGGAWSIKVKLTSMGSALSTGRLVIGMWKVNDAGSVTGGPYIDPTCSSSPCGSGGGPGENTSANISTSAGTASAITTNVAGVPAFSLASNEHLYVQFWRHQTAGTTGNSISTLYAYDGTNQITHPSVNGFPSDPTLQSPAAGARVSSKTLTVGYSDPDNDTGTVDIHVCSDAGCSSVVASTTLNGVTSGSSATWTPALADGTYYWQAHATDSAGNQSNWTATQSFTVDATNPTATLQSPANAALTNASPTLTATYADGGAGDAGSVDLRVCSDSGCAGVVGSTTVAGVADGANATWTPALPDGTYYWHAHATDGAGNQSAWTATRSFTLDTTPPTATINTQPAALTTSSAATFTFSTEPGATLACDLDGGGFASCSSPKSYSGLADGSHTFQVKATDAAGNTGSAASSAWTVDTTPPTASITSQPASPSNSSAPSFSFSANEGGSTFQCKLDSGAWGACTSPSAYAGVADGSHTFQVKATDPAGNTGSPASSTWTVDTVAPTATIGSKPAALSNSSAPSFSFSANETGSSFQCALDGGGFAACSSPKSYAGVADGSHTFQVEAIDAAGNTSAAAAYTWTIDTVPPVTTISGQPAALASSSAATFTFAANEAGSTYQCRLDGGAYAACSSPKSYTGLADGAHTFDVTATDQAGNTGAAASYAWTSDTTPATATITSQPASLTSSSAASLTFTATEAGSTFQCQLDGGGFAACTSPASFSGLGDGNHTFQVKATDPAGNTGAAASASWTSDATAPSTPTLVTPADGARTNGSSLVARFTDASGQGKVLFRVCTDPGCASAVAAWVSALGPSGSNVTWALGGALAERTYYWQALAADAAGNQSAWSSTSSFTLDLTPPAAPTSFAGTIAGGGLTLSWTAPPDGDVGGYVLYVNGTRSRTFDAQTTHVDLGTPAADTPRVYTVAAVDTAGNEGPQSAKLIAVPNLAGLKLPEALAALAQRGLSLGDRNGPPVGLVTAQSPAPPAVASPGDTVAVTLGKPVSTPPPPPPPHGSKPGGTKRVLSLVIVGGHSVSCAPSDLLSLQIGLSSRANVTVRFLTMRGVPLASQRVGSVAAGSRQLHLRLPAPVARPGRYRVIVLATVQRQLVRAEMQFSLARLKRSSGAQAATCGTPSV
jgi:Bacterial Ig-like domain/PASTA domain